MLRAASGTGMVLATLMMVGVSACTTAPTTEASASAPVAGESSGTPRESSATNSPPDTNRSACIFSPEEVQEILNPWLAPGTVSLAIEDTTVDEGFCRYDLPAGSMAGDGQSSDLGATGTLTIRRYSYSSNQILTLGTLDVSRDFGGSTPDEVYESSRIAIIDVAAVNTYTNRATDLPEVGGGSVVDFGGGNVTWTQDSWFDFSASGETVNEQSGEAALALAPAIANKDPFRAADNDEGESCSDLFGAEMTAQLGQIGLVLDQETPGDEPAMRFEDNALQAILMNHSGDLTCMWRSTSTHYGISTRVMKLTEQEMSDVATRLNSLPMMSEVMLGGTRYSAVTAIPASESVDGTDSETGQSHYLRDKTWVATTWSGPAPNGYTLEIVKNLT